MEEDLLYSLDDTEARMLSNADFNKTMYGVIHLERDCSFNNYYVRYPFNIHRSLLVYSGLFANKYIFCLLYYNIDKPKQRKYTLDTPTGWG